MKCIRIARRGAFGRVSIAAEEFHHNAAAQSQVSG